MIDKVIHIKIAHGDLGVRQTLQTMQAYAMKAARTERFHNLSAQLGSIENVDSFVRQSFRYQVEPYEMFFTPEKALDFIERFGVFQGDCDDVATFIAAILVTKRIPVWFEALRTKKNGPLSHVYVKTMIPGYGEIILDPTVTPGTTYKHFGVIKWPVN